MEEPPTEQKEYAVVTSDDALYKYRLRVFALAGELDNVQAACRIMGVHPSTYYRWRRQVLRYGLEILRPRERRAPKMPNATPVFVEQRVLAFALGHPGFGPGRIAAELRRTKWGGIRLSPNGVWRVLCRHGLNTRSKRLALVAGYSAPPLAERPAAPPARHIEADHPGQVVQMDCFYVGRLHGTKGAVWQYTAIDVASSYGWAELHPGPVKHPSSQWTSALAKKVAADLAARGWRLETVTTDHGSEFKGHFVPTLEDLGAHHRRIVAGRPQSNGCVERLHETILEECWKPAFARHLLPGLTGLREELRRYLRYYNTDRAHTGRLTKGRTPEEVIGAAKMFSR
ncbi:MAG TPA: helix-turn-helix domain-containing protein [Acidimicrobiales bacterium]|nr:helix-turn-helix domain-containing protein [Acidimicrobiales bacterium]